MLRAIGSRVIIPAGDTGCFCLPLKKEYIGSECFIIFSVYDPLTRTTLIEKEVFAEDDSIFVNLESGDTMHIEPGKYRWDIKVYFEPIYDEEDKIIGGSQVDSYYSAYGLPLFIIKEVGKSDVY